MTIQSESSTAAKAAKTRKAGIGVTLRKISEMTAQAAEQLRREEHRAKKEEERVRILLFTYVGPMLEMLKRVEIPDGDREFLKLKGYIRDRKDR